MIWTMAAKRQSKRLTLLKPEERGRVYRSLVPASDLEIQIVKNSRGHIIADISGLRFGRLTAVNITAGENGAVWRFRCDCGNEITVPARNVMKGNTSSCGCFRLERLREQMAKPNRRSRAYQVWLNMKSRCYYSGNNEFASYGGRGISVCPRWFDFDAFFVDMGEPEVGMTIERKDVDGNYEPSNCTWIPRARQARNKTNTVWVELDGKRLCLREACDITGVNYSTAYQRLRNGWPHSKALRP